MEPKTIGLRIRELRERLTSPAVSQSDLGRALGLSAQAVQKWEAGNSEPRQAKWGAIASALRVSVRELLEGTSYSKQFDVDQIDEKYVEKTTNRTATTGKPLQQTFQAASNIPQSESRIPLISWESANKWGSEMRPPYEGIVEEWITLPFDTGERSFVVRIDGESNFAPGAQKSYAPGDFVVIDPSKTPTNRCMVMVKMPKESRAIFKQLLMDGDQRMLKSLNPSWPNSIVPFPSDGEIIGVAHAKWVLE